MPWALAIVLVGLALTAALDQWRAWRIESAALEHYRQLAEARVGAGAADLNRALQALEALQALFDSNDEPAAADFARLSESFGQVPGVSSLLAARPVGALQRPEFEAHWRTRYPGFVIRFRNPTGQQMRSPSRMAYLPVIYGEARSPSRFAIGLDLGADKLLRGLLETRRPGVMLSAPYRDDGGQVSVLALGWQRGGEHLFGLVLSPTELLHSLPGGGPLRDYWFDVTDAGRAEPLYPSDFDNAELPLRRLASREVGVAGRVWRLEARLPEAGIADASMLGRLETWLVGILATLALAGWSLRPSSRAEALVGYLQAESGRLNAELEAVRVDLAAARRDGLRLQTILDTANEAVVLIDGQGCIELFNAAAEKLFGYRADEVLGQDVATLMPESYRGRHDEALAHYQRTGLSRVMGTSRELLAQKKGGALLPVEISLNEFRQGEGRYFVGVIRDVSDRKRAERMLFESEYKHRAILDAAHIGIYVLQEGRLRYVNPAFANYFGRVPADLIDNASLQDLLAPDWSEALAVALDPARSGGRPAEMLMQRPDGSRFYALITAKPIIFDNQPGLAGSLLDIAARKAAEEAMLRAEIRNVAILEAIPDLMLQLDAAGTVIDCRGQAGGTEFGLSRDAIGQHYWQGLPPMLSEPLGQALADVGATRLRSFEYSLRVGGGQRHFEGRLTPASEGEWLVMVRDITERKLIEAELIRHRDHLADMVRERTAELDTLFAASPLPTAFVSHRRIVEVNNAFETLFGHPKTLLIGQSIRILLDSDEAFDKLEQDAYRPLLGGGVVRIEVRYRTADGRSVLCEAFGKAIDPESPMAGTIWVYQDIGERRAAEEAQRHAIELAEEANRAKSEFLANMSHELRTPMHAVLSFAELGERRTAEGSFDKSGHYFNRIHQSGQRLLQILNDLLDLSKLEAGKMRYEMQPLDLRLVVHDVAEEFVPLARARAIRIETSLPSSLPSVRGDPLRLGQVLRNLVSNALKFSPDGGFIHLEVEHAGDLVRLRVQDEGVGIPDEELAVIFDKFVQSSKTKTGAGGTGLGLAISREIVEAHGGTITAGNRQDSGACFEVCLHAMA
ncbi:PAS domain S-box protein [Chitinimonas koreensis]|uniref:PAS domain S-box protein n=1 Tax=Chitinimonas koreensis TaxID=356302 RepID=UPI00146F997F|nr:PAS domain S-box protein [Chitinimonas koreensis]QNM97862.1 PAS domain S-box protein [Chitinimonas koreensis]